MKSTGRQQRKLCNSGCGGAEAASGPHPASKPCNQSREARRDHHDREPQHRGNTQACRPRRSRAAEGGDDEVRPPLFASQSARKCDARGPPAREAGESVAD